MYFNEKRVHTIQTYKNSFFPLYLWETYPHLWIRSNIRGINHYNYWPTWIFEQVSIWSIYFQVYFCVDQPLQNSIFFGKCQLFQFIMIPSPSFDFKLQHRISPLNHQLSIHNLRAEQIILWKLLSQLCAYYKDVLTIIKSVFNIDHYEFFPGSNVYLILLSFLNIHASIKIKNLKGGLNKNKTKKQRVAKAYIRRLFSYSVYLTKLYWKT